MSMILVTGASGYVGRTALHRLSTMGYPVVAMARNIYRARQSAPDGIPIRIADYDDRESLERALEGVAKLLFIASDGDGRDVMRHHANVIDAAATCGVEHVTFTSIIDIDEASPFYFTPVYRDAERRLVESRMRWTIVRCGLYSDFVFANWLQPARLTGEVAVPLGAARIAPISRDDIAAAVAAATLLDRDGSVHDLTGPRSYSLDEIVAVAGRAFGMPIRYASCSPADYLQRMWIQVADPWPHAFSTLCASICQGRYSKVSSQFENLLGRPPESFEDFLKRTVPATPVTNGA